MQPRTRECCILNVLLTRSEEDSQHLRPEIEALGHEVIIEPLLVIEPIGRPVLVDDHVQLFVLTSAHAVPAIPDQWKTHPIYAVGEATAAAARAAGCCNVSHSDGDARDLSRLIVEKCRPGDGGILHLSGEVIREGLAETLTEHGFEYRRDSVYRAVAKTNLSDQVVSAWRHRMIHAVLLFSPRTAAILADLLRQHDLESYVDTTSAICLSEATAAPCKDFGWKAIQTAVRPNRRALIRAMAGNKTVC